MKRSRRYIRAVVLATITFSVVLIASFLLPDRAVAATADVTPDSVTIDPGKTSFPKTVLGDEPIRADAAQTPGSNSAPPLVQPQGMDFPRVLGALGIVIGLIFVLRWLGRYFFPGVAGRGASRAIEVLSRSPLSPKQQLMLVRVGRRLIVVGDTGSQMSALCEITDPDEIASLVGQLRDEKATPTTRAFGAMFGSSRRAFETEADSAPADEARSTLHEPEVDDVVAPGSAREELNGLRDRVRMLAEQFKAG